MTSRGQQGLLWTGLRVDIGQRLSLFSQTGEQPHEASQEPPPATESKAYGEELHQPSEWIRNQKPMQQSARTLLVEQLQHFQKRESIFSLLPFHINGFGVNLPHSIDPMAEPKVDWLQSDLITTPLN